jgi:hypothetical protein
MQVDHHMFKEQHKTCVHTATGAQIAPQSGAHNVIAHVQGTTHLIAKPGVKSSAKISAKSGQGASQVQVAAQTGAKRGRKKKNEN